MEINVDYEQLKYKYSNITDNKSTFNSHQCGCTSLWPFAILMVYLANTLSNIILFYNKYIVISTIVIFVSLIKLFSVFHMFIIIKIPYIPPYRT